MKSENDSSASKAGKENILDKSRNFKRTDPEVTDLAKLAPKAVSSAESSNELLRKREKRISKVSTTHASGSKSCNHILQPSARSTRHKFDVQSVIGDKATNLTYLSKDAISQEGDKQSSKPVEAESTWLKNMKVALTSPEDWTVEVWNFFDCYPGKKTIVAAVKYAHSRRVLDRKVQRYARYGARDKKVLTPLAKQSPFSLRRRHLDRLSQEDVFERPNINENLPSEDLVNVAVRCANNRATEGDAPTSVTRVQQNKLPECAPSLAKNSTPSEGDLKSSTDLPDDDRYHSQDLKAAIAKIPARSQHSRSDHSMFDDRDKERERTATVADLRSKNEHAQFPKRDGALIRNKTNGVNNILLIESDWSNRHAVRSRSLRDSRVSISPSQILECKRTITHESKSDRLIQDCIRKIEAPEDWSSSEWNEADSLPAEDQVKAAERYARTRQSLNKCSQYSLKSEESLNDMHSSSETPCRLVSASPLVQAIPEASEERASIDSEETSQERESPKYYLLVEDTIIEEAMEGAIIEDAIIEHDSGIIPDKVSGGGALTKYLLIEDTIIEDPSEDSCAVDMSTCQEVVRKNSTQSYTSAQTTSDVDGATCQEVPGEKATQPNETSTQTTADSSGHVASESPNKDEDITEVSDESTSEDDKPVNKKSDEEVSKQNNQDV